MNAATLTLDTLGYADELKLVGVPDKQAKVHAKSIARLVTDRLATKEDLKVLENKLESKMATKEDLKVLENKLESKMAMLEVNFKELEISTKYNIKELETNTKHNLKELEYRMLIKLGSLMCLGISAIAVLIKMPV